jgi:hypothetical protein
MNATLITHSAHGCAVAAFTRFSAHTVEEVQDGLDVPGVGDGSDTTDDVVQLVVG